MIDQLIIGYDLCEWCIKNVFVYCGKTQKNQKLETNSNGNLCINENWVNVLL